MAMTVQTLMDDIISKHRESVQQLEETYMNYINQLLQQKTMIQNQLNHELHKKSPMVYLLFL